MSGIVGILSVGAGDTKLVFDKDNPADCIRAARIVKDMLRRGYALLVEVERDGKKAFQRVHNFREDTFEYIIADFDPLVAQEADKQEAEREQEIETPAVEASEASPEAAPPPRKRGRPPKTRSIDATSARAVAVPRSAGG